MCSNYIFFDIREYFQISASEITGVSCIPLHVFNKQTGFNSWNKLLCHSVLIMVGMLGSSLKMRLIGIGCRALMLASLSKLGDRL